jgi:mRNA interferase MazF
MIKRGDIVLLSYPFTDLSGDKPRPAVVISDDSFNNSNQDVVFIFITREAYNSPFDIRIESADSRFPLTGLKSSSTFRTAKIMTLDRNLARKRLGTADPTLLSDIEFRLKSLFNIT